VLSWVLIVAVAGTAIYLLLRRLGERAVAPGGVTATSGSAAPRPRDSAEWMAWAREAASAGRLRAAATGVYQATILRLDARGAVRYREWKTPGDYAVEMPATEPLRAPFMDFLGRFLELAFGASEPTTERYEAFAAAASRMGDSA